MIQLKDNIEMEKMGNKVRKRWWFINRMAVFDNGTSEKGNCI